MTRDHLYVIDPLAKRNSLILYGEAVERRCQHWEGKGEARGQNNMGPWIEKMHRVSGVGRVDREGLYIPGPWCGVGSTAMCVEAARECGHPVPFVPSRGAQRFVKNVGKSGSFIVKPRAGFTRYKGELNLALMEHALAIAWHRHGSWIGAGHVELLPRYNPITDEMTSWSPNTSPPLSVRNELNERLELNLVRGQAVWHRRVRTGKQWRKDLSCIATLM